MMHARSALDWSQSNNIFCYYKLLLLPFALMWTTFCTYGLLFCIYELCCYYCCYTVCTELLFSYSATRNRHSVQMNTVIVVVRFDAGSRRRT